MGFIVDKQNILNFFEKKGQKNVVLRVVDVLGLSEDSQRALAEIAEYFIDTNDSTDNLKRFFLGNFPAGYMLFPIRDVLSLQDEHVAMFQQITYEYRELRLGKGEPSRREMCNCNRRLSCKKCGGEGFITIYLEMSDEERRLSEQQLSAR